MKKIMSQIVVFILIFSLVLSFTPPLNAFAIEVDESLSDMYEDETVLEPDETLYTETDEDEDVDDNEEAGIEDEETELDVEIEVDDSELLAVLEELETYLSVSDPISINVLIDFYVERVWNTQTLSYEERLRVLSTDIIVVGYTEENQLDMTTIQSEVFLAGIDIELYSGNLVEEPDLEENIFIDLPNLNTTIQDDLYLLLSGDLLEVLMNTNSDDGYQKLGVIHTQVSP